MEESDHNGSVAVFDWYQYSSVLVFVVLQAEDFVEGKVSLLKEEPQPAPK